MAERRGLECRQLSRGRGGAEHELLGQEQAEQPRAAHQVGGGWRGECGARGRQREGAGRAGLGCPLYRPDGCMVNGVYGKRRSRIRARGGHGRHGRWRHRSMASSGARRGGRAACTRAGRAGWSRCGARTQGARQWAGRQSTGKCGQGRGPGAKTRHGEASGGQGLRPGRAGSCPWCRLGQDGMVVAMPCHCYLG